MADKKISQLTSLAQGDVAVTTDTLPIVDASAVETKKIAVNALVGAAAAAGLTSVDINSGTIDGTSIGSSSASTGAFTTLSASSTVSGTGFTNYFASPPAIGSTAANTGAFTTLTTSSTVTLNGGTANGVLYLNGSKVATSGSALTFDGTDLATTGGVRLNNAQYYYGKNAAGSAVRLLGINAGNVNYVGAIDSGPTEVNYGAASTVTAQYWNISGSESMRLTSTGLGIGTSSPTAKLDVRGGVYIAAATPQIQFVDTDNNADAYIQGTDGNLRFFADDNQEAASSFISWAVDGSEQARLNTTGLGIGTSSPTTRLHVDSAASNTTLTIESSLSGSLFTSGISFLRDGTLAGSRIESVRDAGAGGVGINFLTTADNAAEVAGTLTSRMVLDRSGKVGIGTTSPAQPLHVDASGGGVVRVTRLGTSATAYGQLENDGTNSSVTTTGALIFNTGSSPAERARITSGGYFKASNSGTYNDASASYHELRGNGTGDWTARTIAASTTGSIYGHMAQFSGQSPNNTTSRFFVATDSTTDRFIVYSNGGIANYQANDANLSDQRVKKDVKPLGSMWDKFKAIEIVTFKYNDQTHDDDNIGVIAQQVETVAPEFIDVDGFGETPEGEEPLKTVYTTDMYHAAIKALQEAMARIEKLEAEVAALKGA